MTFGSSPRREIPLSANPSCLAEVSFCGKDVRRSPRGRHWSGPPTDDLTLNSGLSLAAHAGEEHPLEIKPVWCPRASASRRTGSPAGRLNHPLSRPSQADLRHRIS